MTTIKLQIEKANIYISHYEKQSAKFKKQARLGAKRSRGGYMSQAKRAQQDADRWRGNLEYLRRKLITNDAEGCPECQTELEPDLEEMAQHCHEMAVEWQKLPPEHIVLFCPFCDEVWDGNGKLI